MAINDYHFITHWRRGKYKGEESLKQELARRHATSAEELAHIPVPPRPTL